VRSRATTLREDSLESVFDVANFQPSPAQQNRDNIKPAHLILYLFFSAETEGRLADPHLFPGGHGELRRTKPIVGPHLDFAENKNFTVFRNDVNLGPFPAIVRG
jgi:hypothetical protein